MAIITNKPTSVSADSTTSLQLNKADLQAKLEALSAGAYWEDQGTWKGVAFLFENSSKQKVIVSFDASGNTANLQVSEFFVDGDIQCKRIDVIGFANDYYTIFREDFTTASEFDIEITDGYAAGGSGGGGGGGGGGPVTGNTLALYHFDNDSFDVYGNDLIPSGVLTYNPGKFLTGVSGFGLNATHLKRDAAFLNSIGTTDFTIECFVKLATSVSPQTLFCIFQDPSPGIVPTVKAFELVYDSTTENMDLWVNSVKISTYDFFGYNDNNWHHLVVQRLGGAVYCYIDGTQVNGLGIMTEELPSFGHEMAVGYGGSSYPNRWEGEIDELRISIYAVYNQSGFTAPTSPFNETGGQLNYLDWDTNLTTHTAESDGGIYGGPGGAFPLNNIWAVASQQQIPAGETGEFTFIINNFSTTPNDFAFGIGKQGGGPTDQYYFGFCWLNSQLRPMIGGEVPGSPVVANLNTTGEVIVKLVKDDSERPFKAYVNNVLIWDATFFELNLRVPNSSTSTWVAGARTVNSAQNVGLISAYKSA